MNKSYFLILCFSCAVYTSFIQSGQFLKFMTPDGALTYHGEKIVYFGVGTCSTITTDENIAIDLDRYRRWGRWQYLPTFMSDYIKQQPTLCACISFDAAWKEQDLKAVENLLAIRSIQDVVRNNPLTMRIISNDIHASGAPRSVKVPLVETYLRSVLKNKGVVILSNFAPPAYSLEIDALYNQLAQEYPQSVCLLFPAHIWSQGKQFSLYEIATMKPFVDPRTNSGIVVDLFKYWENYGKNVNMTFPWEQIIRGTLNNPPFPYIKRAAESDSSDYDEDVAKLLGYNPDQPYPDTSKLIEDIICENFSAGFIPPNHKIIINMGNPQFTLNPNIPKMTLTNIATFLPLTDFKTFPPDFVAAVSADLTKYRNHLTTSRFHELANELTKLAAFFNFSVEP